ncbi:MAG: EamA family transporter [Eubacterium sp.]
MNQKNKGILYIIIAAALMSTGGIFIKSIQASAITIAFTRSMIAGLVFLPFVQWKKVKFNKNFIQLILAYAYLMISFVLATKLTTAANAIILQCTAPLWLYMAYIINGKKKIVAKELIPRIAILVGIFIIFLDPSNAGGGQKAIIGNLLALSSGIAYAIEQYLFEKKYPMNDMSIIGIINLCIAGVAVVCLSSQISYATVTPINWLYLVLLGVVQIGISYLFFIKGVRFVSAFEASILSLLEPILNPLLVFFFIGEAPSIYTLIGFAGILSGIILSLVPEKNEYVQNTTIILPPEDIK